MKSIKCPSVLINASWGGTPIEAWMSEEGFKEFPDILTTIQKNKDTAYINGFSRRAFTGTPPPRPEDKGITAATPWLVQSYIPKGGVQ